MAKLYRMRSAGKTDRRSLAGSILFISGQDGRGAAPEAGGAPGVINFFFFVFVDRKFIVDKQKNM
ncbi:hypothetical protein AB9B36_26150, partial [Klebsiella pneumoniae]|uniref:hypothetical protein n=1 Tax=Klebsiella pneumoniae TaxID=573 RepID=UPI003510792B